MVKEELQEGHIYIIKHGGARVAARFIQLLQGSGFKTRSYTHFKFVKLSTNREVVLYSTQKILREVQEDEINSIHPEYNYRAARLTPPQSPYSVLLLRVTMVHGGSLSEVQSFGESLADPIRAFWRDPVS